MNLMRLRSCRFLVALGMSVSAAALAVACEDSSSGSPGAFAGPDASFGVETSSGGPVPVGEGGAVEGGTLDGSQPDASVNEPAAPVTLTKMAPGYLRAAASADGSAIVISSPLGGALVFSFYEPATGWTAGAPVPGLPVTGVGTDTAVAMDGKGNAFLAWTQQPAPAAQASLYLARYDHATHAWSAPLRPDTTYTGAFLHVAVSASASGDALAVVSHFGAADHDVVAQHYAAASGTWTPEMVQARSGMASFNDNSEVHLTDSGRAVAFINGTGAAITRSAAGVWTVVSLSLGSNGSGVDFQMERAAINEAGDILLGYDGSGNAPFLDRYDAATSTWTTAQLSTETTSFGYSGCATTVGLAANGDGVYARCYDGAATHVLESYTFTKATGTWSPVSVIPAAGNPGNVTFAFDKLGNGLALDANVGPTNTSPSPVYFNTLSGGAWSPQSPALGGNAVSFRGVAFMSPNGRGFVAWTESSDVHTAKVR